MKNDRAMLADVDRSMEDMFFSKPVNPLQREYFALMMKSLLQNKRGYSFEEYKMLMLIKRLSDLGYSVNVSMVWNDLELSQDEINSIPQMTDNDILVFCQDKYN